jgi:2-polyprenyl-3-methyl-5-hydroxy-6-metoxy-1,4-benzoquinol methylase
MGDVAKNLKSSNITEGEADELYLERIMGYATGMITVNCVILGHKLNIYQALKALDKPSSAPDIAKAADNINERYLTEWLRQQAAAKLISCNDDATLFWLDDIQKKCLTSEQGPDSSPCYMIAMLESIAALSKSVDTLLPDAYKTGQGISYDQHGDEFACALCRDFGVWLRHCLVDKISSVPGLKEKLEAGAMVADVGCGGGEAIFILAAAFPNSAFHGFDTSHKALNLAKTTAKENNLSERCSFFDPVNDKPMEAKTYDIVMTHDAIHDMNTPHKVIPEVAKSIKHNGCWIIGDIGGMESHKENVLNNPMAPIMYGFSCHVCLPSAMIGPDAMGLGTLGWNQSLAEKMLKEAGFNKVEVLQWDHPINRYYMATF